MQDALRLCQTNQKNRRHIGPKSINSKLQSEFKRSQFHQLVESNLNVHNAKRTGKLISNTFSITQRQSNKLSLRHVDNINNKP